jgi:hypothetical protein
MCHHDDVVLNVALDEVNTLVLRLGVPAKAKLAGRRTARATQNA